MIIGSSIFRLLFRIDNKVSSMTEDAFVPFSALEIPFSAKFIVIYVIFSILYYKGGTYRDG